MDQDSVTVDSAVVYEIPEIIQMGFESRIERILNLKQNIEPEDYDFTLTDALFHTPFMTISYGDGQLQLVSQKGKDPKHTTLFLNNHHIDNPLCGYLNLVTLPIQFIDKISVGANFFNNEDINLTTKVNHYDKPFSSIKFATGEFGTSVYNIDFTRPITNEFGFYLSGLHWNSQGHRENLQFKINSFYTNLYYNHIFPMRLDFLYFSNDYSILNNTSSTVFGSIKDKFIDACLVGGNDAHQFAIYHTMINSDYSDTIYGSSNNYRVKNYGIDIDNYHMLNGYEVTYRVMGLLSDIDSDIINSHSVYSLNLCATVRGMRNIFLFSVTNRGEYRNENTFFYAPRISIGVNIFDSTYLCGAVSRGYRYPSIAELNAPHSLSRPDWQVKGNSELLPEYYWTQECGFKRKNSALIFYKYEYDNLIIVQAEEEGNYTYQNIDSWQTIGLEGFFELPIRLNSRQSESVTEVSLDFSGNYLFKGDSLPFLPEGNAGLSLSFKRNTERFGLGITIREKFIGHRQDMDGRKLDPFRILSLAGKIRFLTLSFILRLDNVFNEGYAFIPPYVMEPRHIDFSIKWEFWD